MKRQNKSGDFFISPLSLQVRPKATGDFCLRESNNPGLKYCQRIAGFVPTNQSKPLSVARLHQLRTDLCLRYRRYPSFCDETMIPIYQNNSVIFPSMIQTDKYPASSVSWSVPALSLLFPCCYIFNASPEGRLILLTFLHSHLSAYPPFHQKGLAHTLTIADIRMDKNGCSSEWRGLNFLLPQ